MGTLSQRGAFIAGCLQVTRPSNPSVPVTLFPWGQGRGKDGGGWEEKEEEGGVVWVVSEGGEGAGGRKQRTEEK